MGAEDWESVGSGVGVSYLAGGYSLRGCGWEWKGLLLHSGIGLAFSKDGLPPSTFVGVY